MTETPITTTRKDLTPKRYPAWVWGGCFVTFTIVSAALIAGFLTDGVDPFAIGILAIMGGAVGLIVSHALFLGIHINPKGDRVSIRQGATVRTITYSDLQRVTYFPDKDHAVHLQTATEEITVVRPVTAGGAMIEPFQKLINELGELTGRPGASLTHMIAAPGQAVEPIVMFDTSEGDRINGASIHAARVHRQTYLNAMITVPGGLAPTVLAIVYIVVLPPVEAMGLSVDYGGIIAPILIFAMLALGGWSISPGFKHIWAFATGLGSLAALGYGVGHSLAGAEHRSVFVGAALCFVTIILVARLLRTIGLWLEARTIRVREDYLDAIDAVIASGAVKDRSDRWPL